MKQPSIAGLFDVPLRQVPQVRSGDETHEADSGSVQVNEIRDRQSEYVPPAICQEFPR